MKMNENDCNAYYVGETTWHFSACGRERMFSDRPSHIFKHLQNSEHCRTLCSNDCFSILDHASTTFQLKIKEAIHIQWEKPTLNHQLFLWLFKTFFVIFHIVMFLFVLIVN